LIDISFIRVILQIYARCLLRVPFASRDRHCTRDVNSLDQFQLSSKAEILICPRQREALSRLPLHEIDPKKDHPPRMTRKVGDTITISIMPLSRAIIPSPIRHRRRSSFVEYRELRRALTPLSSCSLRTCGPERVPLLSRFSKLRKTRAHKKAGSTAGIISRITGIVAQKFSRRPARRTPSFQERSHSWSVVASQFKHKSA